MKSQFPYLLSRVLTTCTLVLTLLVAPAQFVHAQGCSQPSNLNANVVASGTVALSWSAIQGAANYRVQYRVNGAATWTNAPLVTTTNQVLTGLLPETVYQWRVRADCSTFSSIAIFNTGGGSGNNAACSAPSNLGAVITSPTSATLSWSAISGALYYTVQYRAGNAGAWTTAGSTTGTSLVLSGLLAETVYTWRVKASCSVYSSIATFNTGGTGGNVSCSQPSNLSAVVLTTSSVSLSWSAIQEAFNYTVQYRLGTSAAWITVGPVTGTSITLSGLMSGVEYIWRVRASCSEYSSDASFTIPGSGGGGGGGSTSCSAPSNTNTNAVFPTYAVVSWEAQSGALNYTVQYRLATSLSYTTVGTVTTTTATITGLLPGREYVWRVKANCSPYGSDVQFATPNALAQVNSDADALLGQSVEFELFPNPVSSGQVQIRAAFSEDAHIWMLNSMGQVVTQQRMSNYPHLLDVSSLRPGMYFVRIQPDRSDRVQTIRLVVTR